jgi:MFS family permease
MCLVFYVFHTFRAIYLKEVLNITGSRYGTIAGGISIMGMVGPVFWTTFADHLNRHKECLILACVLSSTFFTSVALLTKDTPHVAVWAGLFLMSQMLCSYGLQPLLDTKLMIMLTNRYGENAKAYYGRQILFGTFGYMTITRIVGYLYEFNRVMIFWATAFNTALFVVVAIIMIPGRTMLLKKIDERANTLSQTVEICEPQEASEKQPPPTSFTTKYIRLFTNSHYMFFLFVTFCNGFSRGVSSHFLPVFTKTDIVGSDDWVVFQAIMGTTMEVVLFSITKQLVDYLGIYWMLVTAQLAMAVRMTFYALIPLHQPEWIYPAMVVELLKGVSYACMQVPGVHIATKNAPAGLEATAIGLFLAMYTGLSPSVAGIIGGYCNENNGQLIFQVSSVFSWLAMVIIFTHFYFVKKYIRFGKVVE